MSKIGDTARAIEAAIAELVAIEHEAKDAEEVALGRYREATSIRQPYTNDIQALCAARDALPGYIENSTALDRCREERYRRDGA